MQSDAPSDTAKLIARSIVLLSHDKNLQSLVPDGEAAMLRQILAHIGPTNSFDRIVRNGFGRRMIFAAERVLLDGILVHYLARKRWIEMKVREALQRGVGQVVIVGAGFDLLAWRLSKEYSGVRFFELDHPSTQAAKREALHGSGINFIPVDLGQSSVSSALKHRDGFSEKEPTISVAEGLLMYLEETKVLKLLTELSAIANHDGGVIFTFMEKAENGSIQFRGEHPAIAWWLKHRQEPFRWGIPREELPAFLLDSNLAFPEVADHDVLRRVILKPLDLAERHLARGECLCSTIPSVT